MALTKISNNSLSAISSLPASIPTGALTLISTQTASSSASIEFTSGIDSTYDSYVFSFDNIHNETNYANFQFNLSTDGGSTYSVAKTTTLFYAYHNESGSASILSYGASYDSAQSTGNTNLSIEVRSANTDDSLSGSMKLFNPSSSTYVKHFISTVNYSHSDFYVSNTFSAGYGNTTSAVNAIKFQMSSGNIDDGIIKLYGVS